MARFKNGNHNSVAEVRLAELHFCSIDVMNKKSSHDENATLSHKFNECDSLSQCGKPAGVRTDANASLLLF